MQDPEIELLIRHLETRTDLTVADYAGAVGALRFLLAERLPAALAAPDAVATADGAMHVADAAFPDWSVHIHGRANDKDGHWRCVLRENAGRDNDRAIGSGRSAVLGQAILAAVLRLSMILSEKPPSA